MSNPVAEINSFDKRNFLSNNHQMQQINNFNDQEDPFAPIPPAASSPSPQQQVFPEVVGLQASSSSSSSSSSAAAAASAHLYNYCDSYMNPSISPPFLPPTSPDTPSHRPVFGIVPILVKGGLDQSFSRQVFLSFPNNTRSSSLMNLDPNLRALARTSLESAARSCGLLDEKVVFACHISSSSFGMALRCSPFLITSALFFLLVFVLGFSLFPASFSFSASSLFWRLVRYSLLAVVIMNLLYLALQTDMLFSAPFPLKRGIVITTHRAFVVSRPFLAK